MLDRVEQLHAAPVMQEFASCLVDVDEATPLASRQRAIPTRQRLDLIRRHLGVHRERQQQRTSECSAEQHLLQSQRISALHLQEIATSHADNPAAIH